VTAPVAIYTALFGGYDRLLEQPDIDGVDFVAFTDSPDTESQTWEIRPLVDSRTPRRRARWVKTSPHLLLPDHEWTIWVDARMSIRSPALVETMIEAARPSGIAAMAHYQRDCIYEEAREVYRKGFDRDPALARQVRRYRESGYPAHRGLVSTGCLARSRSAAIVTLDEAWSREIDLGSERDQISLPFLLWSLDIEVGIVDRNPYRNDLYVLNRHLEQRRYPPQWRQRAADGWFRWRAGLLR
jgi:hypothetical protein